MNFVSDVNASKTIILPDKWCWATLNELMNKIVDGTHHTPTYIENGVPFLSVKDIRDGKIFFDSCKYISQEEHEELCKRCYPEFGDLLITKSGTIGRCAVIKTKQEFSLFVSVALLKPANQVNIDYISLAFQSWFQNINVQNDVTGTAIKNFHLVDFRRLSLPIAPLNEQHRIVAKIEALKARSARVKESLSTIPALLDQFRQSVLAAAFRGDLTAEWRSQNPDVEPASHLIKRIESLIIRGKETGRAATINIIPGRAALSVGDTQTAVPKNWLRVPLLKIARLESGHTPSRKHPEYWDGDISWIGIADARENHGKYIVDTLQHTNQEGLANSAARLLPQNTVCLSRTASVGYAVIMAKPMATSQDFVNWICSDALLPKFLLYAFLAEGEHLLKFGKGTTHTTIYFPEVKAFHITLPPIEEQKQIVKNIELFFKYLTDIEKQYQIGRSRLDYLDQSILSQAFRGELVPQDPNDEPASVLLERIRAEREKTLTPKTKRSKKTKPVEQQTQMELEL